jgi:dihydropteroate synthase
VLEALAGENIAVSVDATRPETHPLALAHGAAYLNGVMGGRERARGVRRSHVLHDGGVRGCRS